MKNFFLPILVITIFGCSGNTNDNSAADDSANAIESYPAEDTQVGPSPNGYATPNAQTDTSQNVKDSLDTLKH
jgi:hypothetical protein